MKESHLIIISHCLRKQNNFHPDLQILFFLKARVSLVFLVTEITSVYTKLKFKKFLYDPMC